MRENAYRLQCSSRLLASNATVASLEDILVVTKVLGDHPSWESEGTLDILRGLKPVTSVRPDKEGSVLDASTFAKPQRIFALDCDAALEEERYQEAVGKLRVFLEQDRLPPSTATSYPAPPAGDADSHPPLAAKPTVEWSVFSGPPRRSREPMQPRTPPNQNFNGGFAYDAASDPFSLAHSAPDMFSEWLVSDIVQDSMQPMPVVPDMSVADPWQLLLVGSSGGIDVEDMMRDLEYTSGF